MMMMMMMMKMTPPSRSAALAEGLTLTVMEKQSLETRHDSTRHDTTDCPLTAAGHQQWAARSLDPD